MNERALFIIVLLGSGCSWGSSQVLGKWATATGYQPFGLIFWQFVMGALLLTTITALRGRPLILTRESLRFAVAISLVGTIIPNFGFYYSIVHLPAGIMSILISATPMLTFPIALALGSDRFSMTRLLGLSLGMVGVALIALPESSLPDPAMAFFLPIALIAPLFYAIEANAVDRLGTGQMDAIQAMALISIVGGIIVLPMTLLSGHWINPIVPFGLAEWSMVLGSVVNALAYASYIWLAGAAGAVYAAQSSYVVTGSGVLWAMMLLGERYSAWVWAALGCMLLGLALVTPRRRERLAEPEQSGNTRA